MLIVQKRIFFGPQKHNRQFMCHIAVWFQLSTCQDLVLLLTFYDLEGYKNMCSVATTQASFSQLYLLGFHFFLLQKKLKKRKGKRTDFRSFIFFSLSSCENKEKENWPLMVCFQTKVDSEQNSNVQLFDFLLN